MAEAAAAGAAVEEVVASVVSAVEAPVVVVQVVAGKTLHRFQSYPKQRDLLLISPPLRSKEGCPSGLAKGGVVSSCSTNAISIK